MNKQTLISNIRKELNAHAEAAYRKGAMRFFNEPINPIGVRTPTVRKIARTYYHDLKALPKNDLFDLCEALLEKKTMEESLIAFAWAYRRKKEYERSDFNRFESWLKNYVTNWALCDDFCTHVIGDYLLSFPKDKVKVFTWSSSSNRWLRRAAAVSLILPVKRKQLLENVFKTADKLLTDEDDLVQKGYGWMLKEASNLYPNKVFDFVLRRKDHMPRTALRYAIEKYPKEMRKEAMKK